jgi:signal peptidase II
VLAPGIAMPIVPGFFDLTLVTNTGGIFGILRDAGGLTRNILFSVVPVIAVVLIAWYGWRMQAARRWSRAALGLILGGATGNLIDRFRLGHVIDFLDAYVGTHHWPAFNLADSGICVGVAILLAEGLFAPGARSDGDAFPERETS